MRMERMNNAAAAAFQRFLASAASYSPSSSSSSSSDAAAAGNPSAPNFTEIMSTYSTVEEFHRVGEGYILTAIVIFGASANVFSIIVMR